MSIRPEWQLTVPDGHGAFNGIPIIHVFDKREDALAFLADSIVAPAVRDGQVPPRADLRCVFRHDHRDLVAILGESKGSPPEEHGGDDDCA